MLLPLLLSWCTTLQHAGADNALSISYAKPDFTLYHTK